MYLAGHRWKHGFEIDNSAMESPLAQSLSIKLHTNLILWTLQND